MSTSEIRPLLATPMLLGECPVWDPENALLYWIDIAGKAVHQFHPDSAAHRSWTLPSEPGCIALCASGDLVVAMRSGIVFLEPGNGRLRPIIDAPYDTSTVRFNDGRCDARGRFWLGTLYDPRDKAGGSLYCLERGKLRDMGKPVTVSNGVSFSTDNKTLFHSDTTAHTITAYDFDLDSGEIGEGRLFKAFSRDKSANYGGRPDGAAVDSENAYWCAMFEGRRVLRLAQDGTMLNEIVLPAQCPTMIALGGEDMRTAFVTTARHNRTDAELARFPLSGCVFTFRVQAPGRREFPYIP